MQLMQDTDAVPGGDPVAQGGWVTSLRRLGEIVRYPAVVVNAVLGVLIIAGGIWAYQTVWGGTGTASATTARAAVASMATVTATVSASGSVASSNVVAANFTTSGTVTKIYVKLGQVVTKGQKLARIDATSADQQLRTAQDNLTAAQDSLTRAKDSADTTAIDSAQLQVDAAQDAVVSAQAAVDGTVLDAPITGTVIEQNGTVGASASSSGGSGASGGSGGQGGTGGSTSSSSSGFIQIADLTKMEVDTAFPEAEATTLKVGMPARISWNALTGATATGTVASIDPTATTTNNVVTYGVVVRLTSLPDGIRIGQSTTVVVTTATKPNVLAIPTTAVTTAGGFSFVQLVAGGITTRTLVQIGLVGDTLTEITSGLAVGDRVALPTATTTGTTTNPFGGGGFGGGFGGGAGGFGGAGGLGGAGRGGAGGTGGTR